MSETPECQVALSSTWGQSASVPASASRNEMSLGYSRAARQAAEKNEIMLVTIDVVKIIMDGFIPHYCRPKESHCALRLVLVSYLQGKHIQNVGKPIISCLKHLGC